MGTRLKRWLVRTAIAALCLLGILLAAGAWLYFHFPSEWVANKINEKVFVQTGWTLKIQNISPFPLGKLSIGPLTFSSPSGKPFFVWKSVEAKYSILPLLKGTAVVSELTLNEPELFITKEGKEWNWEKALKLLPPSPGIFDNVDFERTPLPKLGGEIQKALADAMKGIPSLRLPKMAIHHFRVHFDGGGNTAQSPPIDATGAFIFTPSAQRSDVRIAVAKDEVLQLNGKAIPMSLDFFADWPGDSTATGKYSTEVDSATSGGSFALDLEKTNFSFIGPTLFIPGYAKLSGQLNVKKGGTEELKMSGKIRTFPKRVSKDLERFILTYIKSASLPDVDAQLNMSGRFLVSTLNEIKKSAARGALPLGIAANASAKISGLPAGLLPARCSLAQLTGELKVVASQRTVKADSQLHISKLVLPAALAGGAKMGALDIQYSGSLTFDEFRKLSVPVFTLDVQPLGFSVKAQGEIVSTIPFDLLGPALANPKTRIKTFRESVTTNIAAQISMDAAHAPAGRKDVAVKGKIDASLKLTKTGLDRVDLSINADSTRFSATIKNGPSISGLVVHLPLSKTLWLGSAAQKNAVIPDATVWTKNYAENLRALSPFRQTVRAETISAGGFDLQNVQVDAGFDGSNLVVDHFSAALLGGSIWGRMTLLPVGEILALSAAFEAADIDTAKLLAEKSTGDARVSADARTNIKLRPSRTVSPEGLLDELELQFHLTKIGDQTLNRLITFLDPKGENPSFVQARAMLQNKTIASAIKSPKVSFSVAHGMMDADLGFPSVKMVNLNIAVRGISMKNLLKMDAVRKPINSVAPALEALKYLRLQGVDDSGQLVFSKGTK